MYDKSLKSAIKQNCTYKTNFQISDASLDAIAKFWAHKKYITLFVIASALCGLQFVLGLKFTTANIIKYVLILLLAIYSTTNLIRQIVYHLRVKAHEASIKESDYVRTRNGMPGCGKTSAMNYDAVVLALKLFDKLKYEYFIGLRHKDQILISGTQQEREDWKEIEDAYHFYNQPGTFPCLASNTPLMVNGQKVLVLTKNHALQKEKLPKWTVLIFDEIGVEFKASKKEQNDFLSFSDFCRLCRQFNEFRIFATEQDGENIYKDFRRVVSENKFMVEQKPVLKPLFAKWLQKKLINIFTRKVSQKRSEAYSWLLVLLDRYIKHSGYRKYTYIDYGNYVKNVKTDNEQGRIKTFILPSMLNCQYDDRCFRSGYLAKDKPFKPRLWDSLVLPADEVKNRFLRGSATKKNK